MKFLLPLNLILILILLFPITIYYPSQSLITESLRHLNKPYVYAASGPNTFDCSGFTYYCVKITYGIDLPRSAYAQGYDTTYLKIDEIDNLLPGDLIFFNTIDDNDLSDHAGIYIGNNEIIHCASGAGKVMISSFDDKYFSERFSWGRRLTRRIILWDLFVKFMAEIVLH